MEFRRANRKRTIFHIIFDQKFLLSQLTHFWNWQGKKIELIR
jgi:hypothetical protein